MTQATWTAGNRLERLIMNKDKYSSDDPLPGGVEQYYDTLVALVERVACESMSHEQLKSTITEMFPNATKSTALGVYIGSITRNGYWSNKDGVYKVTPDGHALIDTHKVDPAQGRRMVLDRKVKLIAGYDVVLQTLKNGPAPFDAIDTEVKTALKVDWKSKNQTGFRLSWLRSLGCAKRDGLAYELTEAGKQAIADGVINGGSENSGSTGNGEPPVVEIEPSPVVIQATELIEQMKAAAVFGGDGQELEVVTAKALEFLGFDVEQIGGSGNPDVVATAKLGSQAYRVLFETKSRSSGVVSQNDVNFHALVEHRKKANADFVVVFASDFSGGNLEKWAVEQTVRLLRVEEMKAILLAHAEAVISLDRLQELFEGGGTTDEGVLSSVLVDSESSLQLMKLCRDVYDVVLAHQSEEALLNEHSLFYILAGAYPIHSISVAVELLQSELLAALGRDEKGSLYCRLSKGCLATRLSQIRRVVGDHSGETNSEDS